MKKNQLVKRLPESICLSRLAITTFILLAGFCHFGESSAGEVNDLTLAGSPLVNIDAPRIQELAMRCIAMRDGRVSTNNLELECIQFDDIDGINGLYTVTCTNAVGSGETSCQLTGQPSEKKIDTARIDNFADRAIRGEHADLKSDEFVLDHLEYTRPADGQDYLVASYCCEDAAGSKLNSFTTITNNTITTTTETFDVQISNSGLVQRVSKGHTVDHRLK